MAYIFKGNDPFSSHNKIARLIINHQKPVRSVLDVGCNRGFIGHVLKDNRWDGTIDGLDKDSTYEGSVRKLGYDDFYPVDLEYDFQLKKKYDAIVLGDVLEHLVDPVAALDRLKSYLSDNGVFVISIPNIANFYIRLSLLFGRFNYSDRGILDSDHKRFYTYVSTVSLLKNAGLRIIRCKPTPIPLPVVSQLFAIKKPLFFVHVISDILLRLAPRFFGYQFIFVCKLH